MNGGLACLAEWTDEDDDEGEDEEEPADVIPVPPAAPAAGEGRSASLLARVPDRGQRRAIRLSFSKDAIRVDMMFYELSRRDAAIRGQWERRRLRQGDNIVTLADSPPPRRKRVLNAARRRSGLHRLDETARSRGVGRVRANKSRPMYIYTPVFSKIK